MPRFLVEYPVPNADQLSAVELNAILQQWSSVLNELGSEIQLVLTYVTAHKIYSLYCAQDAALILKHARLAGLPANQIILVTTIIDPLSGE